MFGTIHLNINTHEGDFNKIFITFEINVPTSGKYSSTFPSTLCRPCSKNVICSIFEYKAFIFLPASTTYGSASLTNNNILSCFSPFYHIISIDLSNNFMIVLLLGFFSTSQFDKNDFSKIDRSSVLIVTTYCCNWKKER